MRGESYPDDPAGKVGPDFDVPMVAVDDERIGGACLLKQEIQELQRQILRESRGESHFREQDVAPRGVGENYIVYVVRYIGARLAAISEVATEAERSGLIQFVDGVVDYMVDGTFDVEEHIDNFQQLENRFYHLRRVAPTGSRAPCSRAGGEQKSEHLQSEGS